MTHRPASSNLGRMLGRGRLPTLSAPRGEHSALHVPASLLLSLHATVNDGFHFGSSGNIANGESSSRTPLALVTIQPALSPAHSSSELSWSCLHISASAIFQNVVVIVAILCAVIISAAVFQTIVVSAAICSLSFSVLYCSRRNSTLSRDGYFLLWTSIVRPTKSFHSLLAWLS